MAVKQTGGNAIGKGKAGPGRPKGVPNKATAAIRDMIIAALDKAGGEDYLLQQSRDNPVAFMGLLGKVMPTQITGEDGAAINVAVTQIKLVGPDDHS